MTMQVAMHLLKTAFLLGFGVVLGLVLIGVNAGAKGFRDAAKEEPNAPRELVTSAVEARWLIHFLSLIVAVGYAWLVLWWFGLAGGAPPP